MNIMRKLRGGGGGHADNADAGSSGSHTQLGLMHLKKLYTEYSHPSHPLTDLERDDKLYNMLPLFCKVFESSPAYDMSEKFWDVLSFTQQVSRLIVSEIRKRASNQSTETASCAIARFLEAENTEECSNGWMLLSALNILAAGDHTLIQVMTTASVPSTLVKCLYLFFDLPELPPATPGPAPANGEIPLHERRVMLQKIFAQVLVRLCSHPFPAEELARMDDLTLLFSAITSVCPPHNVMWRKSAAEVLTTLSRHGLTQSVVNYIHNKSCVALCIDNMQRVPELSPLELVEMFVSVFCFLKDSSDVSQTLLEDFRVCHGYLFLSEFLLKHSKHTEPDPSKDGLEQERERCAEANAAIRNLVLMVASLCMCGFTELKPSQTAVGSLFQLSGFTLPQPTGCGVSVRNVQAFQVLQSVFIKSSSTALCCTILDAISSVYHSDNANYFILESQNTLSQFTEKIHYKTPQIQEKFFDIIEFIVFQLNFVPCKELISMSLLLKSNNSSSCSIRCIKTLINILKHNTIFKDVYREVGMLEVFATCLARYSSFLSEKKASVSGNTEEYEQLGFLTMEALTLLLSGNTNNANVFRECGGAKCTHAMVQFTECRSQVLGIIRELMLNVGGDDDMAALLGTLHSAPADALVLKGHILKALLSCLRDSHRTRTVFRKVGGFLYVTSVLVSLDGKLAEDKYNPELIKLLYTVFYTISTAMRFEPANAKIFHNEICMSSLCDTLRLLGCFSTDQYINESKEPIPHNHSNTFHQLFTGNLLEPVLLPEVPMALNNCCITLRFLYDVALDSFDKPTFAAIVKSPNLARQNTPQEVQSVESPGILSRTNVSSLDLTPPVPEPVIIHPGVVIVLLQLLPSLRNAENPTLALALQCYIAEIIKSLVRSERNQQVMCEAGLAGKLLSVCRYALEDEDHPLHVPLQYMLERLAAQSLEPKDLREFLRLGHPLQCILPIHRTNKDPGGPVPLTRIKTLVSMTTPKDFRAHGSCTMPPFVEMDMSAEGFGCLYLPSIAPQNAIIPSVVQTGDSTIVGGIGGGDRLFPPQTGLSFSTWVCVDKFSDPRTDPHCVRLLTIVRGLNNARDDNLVCLAVVLSARDKAIIVSTHETIVPHNVGEWEPEGTGEFGVRVWCPDLLHEGQWHHLVIVLNRAVLKNSSFSLYLDGQHMHTQKLHYIAQNPGGGPANLNTPCSVFGFIGTPPAWRRYSRLCWKQGSCHLVEDVLSASTVMTLYRLGPHYMGSLQAPELSNSSEGSLPLVAEEKVVFGLNARAMTQLTLAKIRKIYSRADNKSIAKQLGMSSHENYTPIKILHNSAGHLVGSARSLGGVVVGYLGVRVFCPRPVATMVDTVGGCSVLLGVIAMAQDVESLYAGVKALVCVVRSNKTAQLEMDRWRGYQTLAMLLRRKRQLLNSHILHLTFSLVGTVDSGRETSAIPNITAFQDLLCDLDVWNEAPPGELLRSLLEHLYELAAESSEKRTNLKIMRDLQLVTKLLHIMSDVQVAATRQVLFSLLSILLSGQPKANDLLIFGQYVASTLPTHLSSTEKRPNENDIEEESVTLRNRCLQILHTLLFTIRNTVNHLLCEEIARVLGFDWILLLLQPNLHPSTVICGLRILLVLCSNASLLQRFRDGISNGGWLRYTELVAQSKSSVVLGSKMNQMMSDHHEIKFDALHVPGFQHLCWLLPHHLDVSSLYFLLTALMLGQPIKHLPADNKFNLSTLWEFLWGVSLATQPVSSVASRVNLSSEATVCLLGMVKSIVHSEPNAIPEWLGDYPVAIIQVLFSLYHNLPDFMLIVMSVEVVNVLAAILFPTPMSSENSERSSGASTPHEDTGSSDTPTHVQTTDKSQPLTDHPVRKIIMDFLRVIIVDSLTLAVTGKSAPVIDLVLDASPDHSTSSQQTAYQSEVLSTVMEHLLTAEMLVGEQTTLPTIPLAQSHTQNIAPNVFYLTARIVDKMWQGNLTKDPHEIFDFVIKLIVQTKRRSSTFSIEGLYHCLNRIILYLLSRATDSVADQMSVLEALHKLTTHRLLIFGAGNHELDFIGCLTYCLLQLTSDMRIMLDTAMRTTWHVNPASELECRDDRLNQHQGKNLMAGAALRVWEELYVCKKPAIEEVFKVSLPQPVGNTKAPDLVSVRDQVFELAAKLWLNYIDAERKATYRVPWELHNHLQSKIQKVTGGLTRLASRSKVKKEETAKVRVRVSQNQVMAWTMCHIGLVRDLIEMRRAQHAHTNAHTQRYVHQEWQQTEIELTRERGLWGPTLPPTLSKWMLDMTEGPCRMRKKMMRNDLFYIHYPYRPELELPDNRQLKYKVATSLDSKKYFLQYQKYHHSLFEPERTSSLESNIENGAQTSNTLGSNSNNGSAIMPPTDNNNSAETQQIAPMTLTRHQSEPGEDAEDTEEEEPVPIPDNQTLLRLLEYDEKVNYMFRCARIQGLDTVEGLLLFGKEHCYVIDGFTLLKNREIRDIDGLSPEMYEPILPNPNPSKTPNTILRQCSKFSYDDIREVHKRRYLLQPMALEVFSGDGRNYLLAFPRKIRNKVYQRFMVTATEISDCAQQSVAGQKRTANVEQATGLLSNLIGETSVTQRWVRGEISNFQYLMHLNTLAGRSYNDLMQYPVFPWILADYDSEELDLTHPNTFRDFSKPMGAQSFDRLEQFRKRYKEWDDPHGETPPYHYGTHYSSAMIVCSYLVRMEPFTQHFLRLQGGHFDLADRMFHSMKEAWLSASKNNMADVKELIPEFFYLPEFLCNSNQFDLGSKQSGVSLGDIVLPPWAKQDPREFIRVHRLALECNYVSQNLHLWIDLIFGYKQQGQPAVDATNVFHHLFYEGNVDIYNIDDPLKKNATIGFINNFGQIPKQLFRKPHPCKKMTNNRNSVLDPGPLHSSFNPALSSDKLFFHNLDNLKPSLQPIKEVKGEVGQILQPEKTVLAVEQNKVLIPPTYNKYIAWGFADHSLRIGHYENDKAVFVCESVVQNSGEIMACVCPSPKLIVTAGTSSVVTVWQYEARRKMLSVKQSLYGHTDAVTCLAASSAYNVIVSGSRDATAIVWDLCRGIFVRQLIGHVGPVAAVTVNNLTGDIATCAATWLHVWSINGDELACVNTCVGRADRMQQILCVAFSQTHEWDSSNVIMTGSTDGVARMWSMDYVQVPCIDPNDEDILTENTIQEIETKTKTNLQDFNKDITNKGEVVNKSGSESSLSDLCVESTSKEATRLEEKEACSDDDETKDTKQKTDKTNLLKSSKSNESEPPTKSDEEEIIPPKPEQVVLRRKSRTNPMYRKSEGGGRSDLECVAILDNEVSRSLDSETPTNSTIRSSKSDTSLTDSFVVVDNEKKKILNQENILREGFKWQRQLVFRSKLTMHTAYDRKDNAEPASVTALSVSKDHRALYVGDARGRIFSWSVAEQPGRGMADHWLKDEGADTCNSCQIRFTIYERKHHCRNCGQVFCSKCSRFESEISRLRILKPVRVCQSCYTNLRKAQPSH